MTGFRPLLFVLVGLAITACSESSPAPTATPATKPAAAALPAPAGDALTSAIKINLNTASEETFRSIPGVGDKMAHEFEEYRPYQSIQQFRKAMAKYVDAKQIAAYEEHVYVPIDFNACDAPTLAQLPGLTEAEAETLLQARPFASPAAFMAALAEHVESADVAAAASMLTTP